MDKAAAVIEALDGRQPCPACGDMVKVPETRVRIRLVSCYRCRPVTRNKFTFIDHDFNLWTYR